MFIWAVIESLDILIFAYAADIFRYNVERDWKTVRLKYFSILDFSQSKKVSLRCDFVSRIQAII